MVSRTAVSGLIVLLVLLLGGVLLVQTGVFFPPSPPPDDAYNRTTVTVRDANGTTLATVEVRIADTAGKRYTGLSSTSSLPAGEGMLFVHQREESHAYVMRNMSFPLDIVFVAADGTITRIHHAGLEPGATGGQLTRYRGRGKYVLEVPRGYTNETGIDEGDVVVVPDDVRAR